LPHEIMKRNTKRGSTLCVSGGMALALENVV
jgi:hypothetical protein